MNAQMYLNVGIDKASEWKTKISNLISNKRKDKFVDKKNDFRFS